MKNLILDKWLEEHHDHPFPTLQEKILLCMQTGRTEDQITNWFHSVRKNRNFPPHTKIVTKYRKKPYNLHLLAEVASLVPREDLKLKMKPIVLIKN